MSTSTAQVLMRKGKRGAAAYIHADCAGGSPQHVGPLLDVLLNPGKAIDEWETLDWCRWLIAGGRTPDEFATVVRSYDKHDKCGLVWIPRVVAYRCRTCGISPCMSICRDCFHRGDHSTHDFNMFLSQAGGACDCGDNSVMKEDGFCSNHGNKCPRPGSAPAELLCVAEAMMPRLVLRLLQHFRENSWTTATNSDSYRIAVHECEGYVQMLMDFNNMGDLMRSAMTKALINPQMYRTLVEPPFPDTEYGRYMAESRKMYEKAIDAFPVPEPPEEYRDLPALAPRLQHSTLLEEFIFWTFKYEFPQNVVCFLLNMLPDQDYKEHLTRTFVMHYARIPLVLETASDPDPLSNRVVHMSVQLFSNEALALRCVQELHLLHVMVLSLRLMMGKILIPNTLHDPNKNFHYVIDCTRRVMKEHCYWPLVSDFNNVLSHKSVALLFLEDDALVDMWFEFLSMLQGMNVNVRQTGGHIEFEPTSYYAAFSCELEAGAYPMWSVLGHLAGRAHAPLARRLVRAALRHLQDWLDAVGCPPAGDAAQPQSSHASFHYPLHRYLAAFLCCVLRGGARAQDALPPPELLARLALHPLRVQSLFYEILAGTWVRNGLQIKGQAMTYIQANFCNSMVDMDIYWLQICAAHLPPDQFVNMCIDMFGVREWLSMAPMSPAQEAEQDAMVEGLLTFLAILVSSRTNLGNDELTQSRLEVSTLLAAGDKTHSQLLELMPERSGNAHTRNFETVLKELSTYRPPPKGSENLEQGLFVPKPIVWEEYYDPLHVLRRAVHRRDFHASMERFTAYVRDKQKAEGAPQPTTSASAGAPLWPPLRPAPPPPDNVGDPRMLATSGVLHGALLSVLHRGVARRGAEAQAPPDTVLALACHLLQLAARLHAQHRSAGTVARAAQQEPEQLAASGRGLLSVFAGASLADSARTVVLSVPRRAPPPCAPDHYHDDSEDGEWEQPARAHHAAPPALPPPLQVARGQDMETDEGADAGSEAPYIRALEGAPGAESLALALRPPGTLMEAPPPPAIDYEMAVEVREWSASPPRALPPAADDTGDILHAEEFQERSLQVSTLTDESTPVGESIISLLLKLHSQLSGRLDSFSLEDECADEGWIGDGAATTGRTLHALARMDARCAAAVRRARRQLWPLQRERQAEQRARERREKEERSRRARERQQSLMAEFARRQREFLTGVQLEADDAAADADHCVICNTAAPRSHCEPLALVVLLQSTAVLGHRRRWGARPGALARDEGPRDDAAAHYYRLHDDLDTHFHRESWLSTAWTGCESGVSLTTCSHRLHLRCLSSYLRTLPAQPRPDFLCPVCRQRANSVLPLAPLPPRGAVPRPAPAASHETLIEEIYDMLRQEPAPPPPPTSLTEAMGKAMEDMTSTAGPKLRQRYGASPAAIAAFVASLARTNLEAELVQRGGSLVAPADPPRYKPKNECIVPLLVVAAAHVRALAASGGPHPRELWRTLCPGAGAGAAGGAGAGAGADAGAALPAPPPPRDVPLLLRDPLMLLLQLLLLAPPHPPYMDIQHFTCMARALLALAWQQAAAQAAAETGAAGRARLARAGPAAPLLHALAATDLFSEDAADEAGGADEPAAEDPALLLLPFLRVVALLQHHLYGSELPHIAAAADECGALLGYLRLSPGAGAGGGAAATTDAARLAAALPAEHARAAAAWARQLAASANRGQLVVRRILRSLHVPFRAPALLQPPRAYERLFSHYHERACRGCGAAPREASVCLMCGTVVCLKQACCRVHGVHEAVQHSIDCGGGTGIFIVVTSTYVIVVRGQRACLWGSVYLDDYDEEDKDLKRGKPLYLSQDRFELLQAQWLAHRFDHTKRNWVWHRDTL